MGNNANYDTTHRAVQLRCIFITMTEEEKRQRRVCFTGHRPEKLTCPEWLIKRDLKKEIRQAVANGLVVFITGMARGVDIWAAEIVIELRDSGQPLKLICACPYDGFEKSWSSEWQERYKAVLAKSDHTVYVCKYYNRDCFQIRNEWMVNHSARVIGFSMERRVGRKTPLTMQAELGCLLNRLKDSVNITK